MVPKPSDLGITFPKKDLYKKRWAKLVKLQHYPSRYPDPYALEVMGIAVCFWELCDTAGLTRFYRAQHGSYQQLTLEFLCTLVVNKNGQEIVSISFRLKGQPYELSVQQLSDILGFRPEDEATDEELAEYDQSQFWSAITWPQNDFEEYKAKSAKSSSIRNPVLRVFHRVESYSVFAKKEGGVTTNELFLLWCTLKKLSANLGSTLIDFLQHQASKKTGQLSCGGVITAIAVSVGIDVGGMTPVGVTKLLDLNFFRRAEIIMQDATLRCYFKQVRGDHFPYPNPILTYVNGWEDRSNWRMNRAAHQEIIAAEAAELPPINTGDMPGGIHDLPHPQVTSSPPNIPLPQPPHQDVPESSRRRRRRRTPDEQAEDRDVAGLHVRMDDFERRIMEQQALIQQQQQFQVEQFDRFRHYQEERFEQFGNMMTGFFDRFANWSPYPPPPPPQ